ncbi:MAG: DUF262 domain-containing protein [Chloroflexi bacterium]|nr:DUF262 domain-containing protein [Chloroflexota bacterium]
MSKVQAQTKSVKQLLSGVKYGIDVFQREYDWGRRQVEDLLTDFENKFLEDYDSSHEPTAVSQYPHYFLGTIITVAKNGKRYIIDGQQRLTTLTLLLIFIHHSREKTSGIFDVAPLIYSDSFGEKSFNIDISERRDCMDALFQRGEFDAADHPDLSVRNLSARYGEFEEIFPETLEGHALPLFVYWLIEKVNIVEIEAASDDNAFTIFETMNDRGVNLSQADMLKGYLLANIDSSDKKTQANDEWRRQIKELVNVEAGAEEDFIKTWLRAKFADSMRERKAGAKNLDFEEIDKFHRWTRDNAKKKMGLVKTDHFYEFITRKIAFYSKYYIAMRKAAQTLSECRETIHFNAHNNFTLQYMLALAPLTLADDDVTAWRKIRLVTTFADIYLARRMVNFRRSGYGTLKYTMFNLTMEIRDKDTEELRDILLNHLSGMWETFEGITGHNWGTYALNNFSGRSIRYLLARMTAWIEQQAGKSVNFRNFLWDVKGKSLEIEHIWADKYLRHQDEFANEYDFRRTRNYFGGLVLLPRGTNQSYSDTRFEDKVEHYPKENLLAASLHPKTYEKNPNFTTFVKRTGLPFKPHTEFKRADLLERQELYRQICEQIWNPDRLLANN